MWSSTASSSTTISIKDNYTPPYTKELLNVCCKDAEKFFEPTKQFDDNYLYNIFGKPMVNGNIKESPPNPDYYRGKKYARKEKLIKLWANKSLFPENKTLDEIHQDDIKSKKRATSLLNKFNEKTVPGHSIKLTKNTYIERSFCCPKIMCYLRWNTIHHTEDILRYLDSGISLFVIDLRFGSQNHHSKAIKQFAKIKLIPNMKIFGLAFEIHSQQLRVGLMYKNQSVYLDHGSTIILTADRRFSDRCTHKVIYVNFSNYVNNFEEGDEIKIGNNDDIIVIVQGKAMNSIVCTVKKDGVLFKRMIVKIPFNRYLNKPPDITTEEREDLTLAISLGCNYLICKCITEPLRAAIKWALVVNNNTVMILQKISFTTNYNTSDIDEIFKVCDGVYINGDSPPETYPLQEYTFIKALEKHKIICRFENIIKGSNKIHDKNMLKYHYLYPDCIVVSPNIYAIKNICSTIYAMYPHMNKDNFQLSFSPICQQDKSIENEFCRQIILLAVYERAYCIIVINDDNEFVKLLTENRPMVPIIASFLDSDKAKHCLLLRNVYVHVPKYKPQDNWKQEINLRLLSCLEYGKNIIKNYQNSPFIFCYPSDRDMQYSDTCRLLYTNNLK